MPASSHQETGQLTIGLHPSTHEENAYIARNQEILDRVGNVVAVPRARVLLLEVLGRVITLRSPKCFDVLILNWTEVLLLSRRNKPTLKGIVTYRFLLRLFRWAAVRLVCVRHNDYPHGLSGEQRDRASKHIARGLRLADAVVAHSPSYAEQHGYHYVPHPLYRLTPVAQSQARDEYVIFGRIMRYKNIGRLIEAWPSGRSLAVIGPCFDDDYLAELRAMAEGKPVRFDVGFHDEQYLVETLAGSSGVIIVNDPGSIVVSGTFFFALSVGVRVLTIDNAFYRWVRTTKLAEYVQTFESIPALAESAAAGQSGEPPNPEIVRKQARALFGDDAVEQAWRSLLGRYFRIVAPEDQDIRIEQSAIAAAAETIPAEDFADSQFDSQTLTPTTDILILLSTPRCGSTLLADLVRGGGWCLPHEYFQPFQYLPLLADRWGCISDGVLDKATYLEQLCAKRTYPSGWLGINLHGNHIEVFEKCVSGFPDAAQHYVHLKRRDRIAQAVSYEIASQTGKWSSHFEAGADATYDFEAIRQRLQMIEARELMIAAFLERRGASPLTVYYEDLVEDPAQILGRMLPDDLKRAELPKTELRPQADQLNLDWSQRFASELRQRSGRG